MPSNQTSGPIAPVESGRSYVVVDFGGTQIRTAVVDVAGRLLTRQTIPTPRTNGPDAVIAAILDQIQQSIAEHPTRVVAVGVSALGPVDPHAGIILNAPTLPDFENVPLGPRLRRALRLPVHVYNDANAAAIAEWRLGAGRGTRDFCYVTVSTGIGCGIISNGQLITGGAGYAGEFGRIRLPLAGGGSRPARTTQFRHRHRDPGPGAGCLRTAHHPGRRRAARPHGRRGGRGRPRRRRSGRRIC